MVLLLTVFQLHGVRQCTLTNTIFFPSHRLLSHITIVNTMDCGERGMNPVAMTSISPRKEYWQSLGSNQQPSVHKSGEEFILIYHTIKSFNDPNREPCRNIVGKRENAC